MTRDEIERTIADLDADMQQRFASRSAAQSERWAKWFAWYAGMVSAIHEAHARDLWFAYAERWRDRWEEAARTVA